MVNKIIFFEKGSVTDLFHSRQHVMFLRPLRQRLHGRQSRHLGGTCSALPRHHSRVHPAIGSRILKLHIIAHCLNFHPFLSSTQVCSLGTDCTLKL